MKKPIIAGVDGSEASLAAAHYAASMAIRQQTSLKLLHVHKSYFYGYGPMSLAPSYVMADADSRQAAKESLTHTAIEMEAAHPGLPVEAQLLEGSAAYTLIEQSQEALATVVGSRGIGGFEELLLGCFKYTSGDNPSLDQVPCTEPHNAEYVGAKTLPADFTYPSADAEWDKVHDECYELSAKFVGVAEADLTAGDVGGQL